MTSPAGQTALSHAAMTALAQTSDDVVAQTTRHSNNLQNQIMSELMPKFKGETANASGTLTARVHEDLRVILQNMQAMSDQVKNTNSTHLQADAAHAANYGKLAGVLNTGRTA